jgi:hypothetical protein
VKKILYLVLCGTVLISPAAHGYPEMIRYGLVSCASCHFSPSGGGLVSSYGREQSSEFLRMFGGVKSGATDGQDVGSVDQGSAQDFDFLHGTVELPDWLTVGGDIRAVKSTVRSADVNHQSSKLTEADVELALTFSRLDLVASGGRIEKPETGHGEFISRRHYVILNPSEDILFRAGRFFPAFGIGTPEQDIGIKRDLGWGSERETYNLEVVYFHESYEITADAIFGRPDQPNLHREEGFSTKAVIHILETHAIGLNMYQGKNDTTERRLYGIYGLLGLTSQLAFLTEIDFQQLHAFGKVSPLQNGRVIYNKLSYEVTRGLNLTATGEQSFIDVTRPSLLQNTFGAGIQAFPIPHLEIQLQYQKIRDRLVSEKGLIDHAWLQVHYYL